MPVGRAVSLLALRVHPPVTPSAAELGDRGEPAVTRDAGQAIGQTLASLGINLDLAPVVDLNVNPESPAIGALGRSFSADPEVVARQAAAFIEGLHAANIALDRKVVDSQEAALLRELDTLAMQVVHVDDFDHMELGTKPVPAAN